MQLDWHYLVSEYNFGMARVIEDGNNLILKLSIWEKIGALHKDVVVPRNKLVKKTVHKNPWSNQVLKGFRAPGAAIPFVILLGTMRYRGGKDFTAIYKRNPVTIYEFQDTKFKRWIVTQ